VQTTYLARVHHEISYLALPLTGVCPAFLTLIVCHSPFLENGPGLSASPPTGTCRAIPPSCRPLHGARPHPPMRGDRSHAISPGPLRWFSLIALRM